MKKLILFLALSVVTLTQFAKPGPQHVDTWNNCHCIGIGIEAPKPRDGYLPEKGVDASKKVTLMQLYVWSILFLAGVGR